MQNIRRVVYLFMKPGEMRRKRCLSFGFELFGGMVGFPVTTGTVACRKATVEDLDTLYRVIQGYAEQGIMLPRTRDMLKEQLDSFVVAEIGDELVGCGSLTRLGQDLVEIRSLGVTEGHKGLGIGRQLIGFLVEEARAQHISKVMALTYEVSFFLKNGFTIVPKEVFPEKVWKDCMNCKKRYSCDEIALLKRLD